MFEVWFVSFAEKDLRDSRMPNEEKRILFERVQLSDLRAAIHQQFYDLQTILEIGR